jgi:hypothetical protein
VDSTFTAGCGVRLREWGGPRFPLAALSFPGLRQGGHGKQSGAAGVNQQAPQFLKIFGQLHQVLGELGELQKAAVFEQELEKDLQLLV